MESFIRICISLGFALVTTFSAVLIEYGFPLVFKRFYDPEQWNKGKYFVNYLFFIVIITLGNTLLDIILSISALDSSFNYYSLLVHYLKITIIVGLFPMTIIYFLVRKRQLDIDLNEAKSVLVGKPAVYESDARIELSGSTKDSLLLNINDFLYMESSGNYVQIYYLHEDRVLEKTLRTSITQMSHVLEPYKFVVRSHRAFLVNINHILELKRSSKGLICMLNHDLEVPVSRTYAKNVRRN